MRKLLTLITLVLIAAVTVTSQTTKPVPTPTPDNDIVKISTNLIQLDVTVTDAKGHVVTDLKPGEIGIYENGQKQNITNFSFISTLAAKPGKQAPPEKGAIPVPVPQKFIREDQVRRSIVLMIDDLNMSFSSAASARKALKKYVAEQMQEGDLVAVIRTGGGIGALQQFTADKTMLNAAIDRIRWNPNGNIGIDGFGGPPIGLFGTPSARITIRSISDVVNAMSKLPGRKSMILLSDGFSLDEKDERGMTIGGFVNEQITKLIDVATRASVVIYTIDSQGLVYTGPTAADPYMKTRDIGAFIQQRTDLLFERQSGPSYIAKGTGGFDIKNSNDISGGVKKILDDQSYYLVGYEPNSETFERGKKRFNRIEVRVTRPNVKVRYRSGFMNMADEEVEAVTSTDANPSQQFADALTSPFAGEGITLRLNALFGNNGEIGTYVRSLLYIEAKDLTFTDQPDGTKKAEFAVYAISFGENGLPSQSLRRVYTLNVKGNTFKKIMNEGFVYHFGFPVKYPGPYQYRVAIRDMQSGKMGSASQFINVPKVKKDSLMLSGLVLDSMTSDQWKQATGSDAANLASDPMMATALRHIKTGSVLSYGFEVYGAKSSDSKPPNLQKRIRVYSDGKLILDGDPVPVELAGQKDLQRIKVAGAVSLGNQLVPGDYILQVIIIDAQAKTKDQLATQFVQFEVID